MQYKNLNYIQYETKIFDCFLLIESAAQYKKLFSCSFKSDKNFNMLWFDFLNDKNRQHV